MNSKKTISNLQLYLTVAFTSCLLISNILTAKTISLPFGLSVTSGILVFPITYILSDVFSEVYGYKWSRITCYIGFVVSLFFSIVSYISIKLPHPSYWVNQNAYETVLGSTARICCASLIAFVVGDYLNDNVFRIMKLKDESCNRFMLRAFSSSMIGELADSFIFFAIAFAGIMKWDNIITLAITQTVMKLIYELVFLPVTNIVVKKVKKVEE